MRFYQWFLILTTCLLILIANHSHAQITPIANIQDSSAYYDGQEVTVEGVVTDGAGVTYGSLLSVYIQDESGKGINIYNASIENEHYEIFARGNLVQVTGTVQDYENSDCTTTEIVDFTTTVMSTNNDEPTAQVLTTGQASSYYQEWDGTLIESRGEIEDIFAIGGGTNITINDGSGSVVFRVWDSTNLTLPTEFQVGNTVGIRGIGSCYRGGAQYLPAYADHLDQLVSVETESVIQTPENFYLGQNVPNPFNPTTEITYTIPQTETVSLQIYDANGKLIKTLVDCEQTTGTYSIQWDGTNTENTPAASGIYLYRLKTNSYTDMKRMVLLK